MVNQSIINEEAKAQEEMVKSVRDLLGCKITLPLGNPSLKYVHTNQNLFLNLPDEFELANFEEIAKIMNSKYTRYIPYRKNRWYIEGITINNDGDKFEMDLDLNPFPTTIIKYRDDYVKFREEYMRAIESNNKNNTTNTVKTNVKSVPKTNTTLKGGEGTLIDGLVKKWVGNATRDIQKAILVHDALVNSGIYYKQYNNSIYKTPEACWNHRRSGLNCGDTAILTTSCMRSAGLNAWIALRCDAAHFFTVVKIGKYEYYSDITDGDGRAGRRAWNTVWQGNKKWCRNYGNRI